MDQIEALAPERDALWKRLEAASFLTADEKRAAAGYTSSSALGGLPAQAGIDEGESPSATRKYRDDQRRVPASQSDGGRWTDGEGSAGTVAGNVRVAQARRSSSAVRIGGQTAEATPAEIMRLSNATSAANAATARVREIDPNWRPAPQAYESVEGAISAREAEAREAEARFEELRRDAVPNTSASWGVNRLRKELNDQGYRFVEPTDAEGYLYRNDAGAEVRIMKRPNAQYRTDPFQKHQNDYYYRYRSGVDQGWGQHTTIPDKLNERKGVAEE